MIELLHTGPKGAGTVAQSLAGEATGFHVSSRLSKSSFMADEDALASAAARSGDLRFTLSNAA